MKAGDADAFQEVYNRYAGVLYSFGRIFVRDSELVKDCIHDLIFDLYKYRKNLADSDNIRNYLFKSLKRKIQHSAKKHAKMVLSEPFAGGTEQADDDGSDAADEQADQMARINRLIDRLPDKQKEIINLKFQLEMSYDEIAAVLEISVESVRTSVYRSIKTIREQLNEKDIVILLILMSKSIENS